MCVEKGDEAASAEQPISMVNSSDRLLKKGPDERFCTHLAEGRALHHLPHMGNGDAHSNDTGNGSPSPKSE